MQCGKCQKPITAQFLEAMGQKLHPDCFACGKCVKPIGASKYSLENGSPYHSDCLAEMKGDICAKCSKPVVNSLTVLGKKFHPECFVCGGCGKNIEGGQVSLKENAPFHPGCLPAAPAAAPASPKGPAVICGGCQQPIVKGAFVTALDKTFHPDCFKCGKCKNPIREPEFKVDGPRAYHAACSAGPEKICPGCTKPITDKRVLEALGALWHPGCFKCNVCQKLIDGGSYLTENDMPVHPECKEEEYEITETFFTSKEPGAEAITVTRKVKKSELEAAKANQDASVSTAAAKAAPKAKAGAKVSAKPASPSAKAASPSAKPASPAAKVASPTAKAATAKTAVPSSPRTATAAKAPVAAKSSAAKPAVKAKAAAK